MTQKGRRELKREETRRRLMREGQRLFAEQGFDHTSVDEIASAAGLSRRTFFHYFDSKEDVVLSRHDDFEQALMEAIRTAPREAPLLHVAEQAVIATLAMFDHDEFALLERLKRETPALRARDHGKYERLERAVAGALAQRSGASPDDLRTRLDAMVVAGVLRVAGSGWAAASAAGVPIDAYMRQVVRSLEAGLGQESTGGR
ncbi:TetR family transcriptional regulator [Longimicrobium sp.]|uniref:TetR family transcriptional regulator n=1 Tax=Longimicrobium sp. TaxID=2029185 RepID=UPI003B3B4CCF